MKKTLKLFILIVLSVSATVAYLRYEHKKVEIIITEHDRYSGLIIVDRLPWLTSDRVNWWIKNEDIILNDINSNKKGDFVTAYFIYPFGDGYKKEGKYDRICLESIPSPNNCLDKDLLMEVLYRKSGNTDFIFPGKIITRLQNGEIIVGNEN
ncbi:DUF943 family protein [Candidatus Pantoea multigeneris]|uniref:DUF943 family protein n=1 Tax=Candidatus Pantoea multigeneris TaxID=2608357 RepID=A0ABX0RC27_9GAMM|nr:DUF943 family protein [Pantoea multigeneris]NIF22910.1 DUF943 family protein [Pantoea multigeneris]